MVVSTEKIAQQKHDTSSLTRAQLKSRLEGKSALTEYQRQLIKWNENVDKKYAWVVLFALFVCMCSLLGPYRIYGLIFAKVTAEGIYSREDASWPASMIITVENLAGPLVSLLTYYLTIRKTLFVGGLLVTCANLATYFSDSLWWDVLSLGCVQGVGYAFVFMPFMEIINNYFLRYRNVALGIALSGGTVSIFAWSPITQYILDNYPWRTAYLFITGLCSLILFMAPLIKPNPRPNIQEFIYDDDRSASLDFMSHQSRDSFSRMSKRALSYRGSIRNQTTMLITRKTSIDPKSGLPRQESIISMNPFASTAAVDRKISRTFAESINLDNQNQQNSPSAISIINNNNLILSQPTSNQQTTIPTTPINQNDLETPPSPITKRLVAQASIYSMDSHLVIDECNPGVVVQEIQSQFQPQLNLSTNPDKTSAILSKQDTLSISDLCDLELSLNQQQAHPGHGSDEDFDSKAIWDILKKPAFHIIWYNELLYFWVFSIYCLVLADLGRDRGCSKDEAELLLSYQSIGELIGRLGLTFLVDLHFLSNRNIATILLFSVCATLALVTQISGFIPMAIVTIAVSSLISLLYIMLNGLLVDYLGERQVTLGYGMTSCISGVLMYFRPQAVGLFRDRMGSYDWLLGSLAIGCAIGGLLWLLEPLMRRCSSSSADDDDYENQKARYQST